MRLADPLLPCPPNLSPQSLGIPNPQIVFARPIDVHKVSLNTYNGLAGAGNTDYVIDGMVPSSAGMPPQSGGDNNTDGKDKGQNQ